MSLPSIILIGAGGHCKSCIDLILSTKQYTIAGIVDVKEKVGTSVLGFPVMASDDDLDTLVKKYDYFVVTVGQIKSPAARIRVYEQLQSLGANIPSIVSPHAYVSPFAKLAAGVMVFHHAVINAVVDIGDNCIINNKALIEHDTTIGAHCHISTAAVLNGAVQVGKGTFIGSNATIRQGITIGAFCTVGAGSAVLTDVAAHAIVAGSPAITIGSNAA
jgi:sugar O-acyltransferase (sialic acid O-acetyltransferase NeuD family)